MQSHYCQSPKQQARKDSCLQQFQKLLSDSLSRKCIKANKENSRSSLQMRSFSKLLSPHSRNQSISQNSIMSGELKKTLNRVRQVLEKTKQEKLIWQAEKRELLYQLEQKNQLIEKLQGKKSTSQHY